MLVLCALTGSSSVTAISGMLALVGLVLLLAFFARIGGDADTTCAGMHQLRIVGAILSSKRGDTLRKLHDIAPSVLILRVGGAVALVNFALGIAIQLVAR